ncbi:unnamed protein product [Durusdinium trenchii]|uniref:Uncharacterized protein n=2 Tax=Durusdinium trenchii TaxID=1381693 RepID=A0ABP0HW32_9DINO
MVIPIPAMGVMGGPPTPYALARRPWVQCVLILQSLCCLARMVVFLDIMGGFLMAIMIAVGICAIREDFNVQLLCYWGFMCLINGSFDLVKLIDVLVKSHLPLFSTKMPQEYNIYNGIALSIPVTTLLGVPLAWWIYRDWSNGGDADLPGPAGGRYQGQGEGPTERSSLLGAPQAGPAQFTAFEGQGRRLGSG